MSDLLITTDDERLALMYKRLKAIRAREDLKLKPLKYLKETFTGYDGVEHPLQLRYYQVQGILHLVAMNRFVLGDSCGLGKTLQSIGALCCLWEKEPDMKVIVLTVMSAVEQWAEEFNRFTTGVKTIIPRNSTGGERRKPGDPRWSVGDFVEIDASKHIPSKRAKKSKGQAAWYTKTAGVYKKYNAEIGIVRETEEDDIIVEFINRDSKLVRIPGAQRFRGVGIKTYTGPEIRKSFYREFEKSTGPTVMIMNYAKAVIDISELQHWSGFALVADEATAFKNPRTETWKVCNHLSNQARRTYGLTATLIKGKLEDGYGIYNVIVPGLFGSYKNFLDNYCVYQMQPIPGSRRKVPVVVGYRKKHVKAFREHIDPFYLGRAKSEVAKELPSLVTREIKVDLDQSQEDLYAEALSGLLEIGEGEDSEMREVTKLTAITYCQQIVNHPALIKRKGRSNKLKKLVELITEGEFADEKIIVFSRLKEMVFLAQRVLEKKGVKSVRVTGDEDDLEREKAKKVFQNPKSGVNVIFITMAGSHAINLQSAMVTVFYDTPFTAGDYIQLLGRKIRIGSIHEMVYAIHLIAKDTVDERVMQILRGKLTLFEAVVGKRIKEADDPTGAAEEEVIETGNEVNDLFDALQSDARRAG